MAEVKDIKYINKEFSDYRAALIDFAQSYFPNTYNDFSPASPGMMFMEMAAYVGDVLSFYQDNQIQENFIQYAKEKENLYTLAYMLGYRPKVTSAATVDVDVYQLVPSILSGSVYVPNFNYALIVGEGTQITTQGNSTIQFYIKDKIDFSISSSLNPTEITVYSVSSGNPQYFLLKKKATATSGQVKSTTFSFSSPEKFPTITLSDTNIISIIKITDSDGNLWYEVPYLAQETIFEEVQNTAQNDPNFAQYSDTTPYLLKLKKVPRRFVTRIKSDNTLEIQFGAGISSTPDEEIIPNADNVGLGVIEMISKLNLAYDPSNFLYTTSYGLAPSNTILTINYLVGGGVESNVNSNTINKISTVNTSFVGSNLNNGVKTTILNSLAVNNPEAASGGGAGDTIDDIRLKSLATFPTQLRTVTLDDYAIRSLALPQQFGSIAKIYVVQDSQLSTNSSNDSLIDNNPLSISLYMLGYNSNKQLIAASPALKQNLKTYLSQYRMLTDAVNIKDAFIINIGIEFEIIVLPNFNNQQVLLKCVSTLQDYFNIDNRQINQPIVVRDLYVLLDKIEGVQTVNSINITNKVGENLGYSKYAYDIQSATKNRIIYPSLDPSIFEIKYPNSDIVGRVVSF